MPACSVAKCAGLAVDDRGLCAVHGAGYKKHDGLGDVRCGNCRGLIRKDEWMQTRDGHDWHAGKTCKTHPDVIAERAKQLTS